MNILITSIGQRGYLVDHFIESAGSEWGIYAADATKFAPALQNAEKSFVIPMANDPNYFDFLLDIALKNNIKGILSINDLELQVLASYKEDFAKHGINIIISDPKVIDLTFDKYKTHQFCIKNNLPVPRTYRWNDKEKLLEDIENDRITFPIIAKPRKGSRSVGIYLIHSKKKLLEEIKRVRSENIPEDEKVIFQEYIDSEQYSIHIFNNEQLEPIKVVSMVNILKGLGETFQIESFKDSKLTELGINIGEKLGHYGPLSADVHQKEDGEYVILEFNPRFSGGYSLSHFVGADFPSKVFQLVKGQNIKKDKIDGFKENIVMLKQFTTQKLTKKEIDNKIE